MPNCRIPRTATPEKAWCVTAGSDRRRRTGKADDDADRWEEQIAVARPTANRSSWPGKSAKRVFALDVPAIHVFSRWMRLQDVDGRDKPGHDGCKYYWLRGSDSKFYFFAGAVLVSAGFAASGFAPSGFVSVFAVSSGLSMRSTLAASRSL